jgi:hypothetical protein
VQLARASRNLVEVSHDIAIDDDHAPLAHVDLQRMLSGRAWHPRQRRAGARR